MRARHHKIRMGGQGGIPRCHLLVATGVWHYPRCHLGHCAAQRLSGSCAFRRHQLRHCLPVRHKLSERGRGGVRRRLGIGEGGVYDIFRRILGDVDNFLHGPALRHDNGGKVLIIHFPAIRRRIRAVTNSRVQYQYHYSRRCICEAKIS